MSELPERQKNLIKDLFHFLNGTVELSRYQILGIMAGVLTGETTLFIGEPGSGKTYCCERIADFFGDPFYLLLHEEMTLSDVIGGYNYPDLTQGRPIRNLANRMLDEKYAVIILDNIYGTNSTLRNALLDIILNKRFINYDREVRIKGRIIGTTSLVDTSYESNPFNEAMVVKVFFANGPVGTTQGRNEFMEEVLRKSREYKETVDEFKKRGAKYTLDDLAPIEETIRANGKEFERRYSSLIPLAAEMIEKIFAKKLHIGMIEKTLEVGIACRLIVETIIDRKFTYDVKKEEVAEDLAKMGVGIDIDLSNIDAGELAEVMDVMLSASLYTVPYEYNELFHGKAGENNPFAKIVATRKYEIEPSKSEELQNNLKNARTTTEFADAISAIMSAARTALYMGNAPMVRHWLNPTYTVRGVKELIEGAKKLATQSPLYHGLTAAEKDRVNELFHLLLKFVHSLDRATAEKVDAMVN